MAVGDADGNGRPGMDKAVAADQLLEKDIRIYQDDEHGDSGGCVRAGGISEWNQATHYMPPFPSRIPIP